MPESPGRCAWCPKPLPPSRRGSARKFCSAGCRNACWSALRRWGMKALAAGVITVETLKASPASVHALPRPTGGDASLEARR